ncbi:MAG: minor capsid protein [Rickettsiales bacterium]
MATSQTLINLDASHQINVQRYGTKLANQVIPFLADLKSQVSATLSGSDTVRSRKRANELIAAITATIDEYFSAYIGSINDELIDFVESELGFIDESVNVVMDVDSSIPSAQQVLKAAAASPMQLETGAISYTEALAAWTATEKSAATRIINGGFAQGRTTNEIARDVNRRIAGAGLNNARSIVRTSINHIANESRKEFYADNEYVTGYRIIATLDSRTTPICRKLDQRVIKPSDRLQLMPPFHFNCRTTITPEIDGRMSFLRKDAKRAAEGGPVSSESQYYDWLKRQSAAYQDEVLGKTKGKIFRNAGLTTKEFKNLLTNRFGQELTLDELKNKNEKVKVYLDKLVA